MAMTLKLREKEPIVVYEGEPYVAFDVILKNGDLEEWSDKKITPADYRFYRDDIGRDDTGSDIYCLVIGRLNDRNHPPFPDELQVLSAALQAIKNYEECNNVTD
jgi:hypothetical protein